MGSLRKPYSLDASFFAFLDLLHLLQRAFLVAIGLKADGVFVGCDFKTVGAARICLGLANRAVAAAHYADFDAGDRLALLVLDLSFQGPGLLLQRGSSHRN